MTTSASSNKAQITKPLAQIKRQYRTASQWQEILDAYEQSNLTQSEFCKKKGIAISNLHAWRRKLAGSDAVVVDSFVELHPPAAQTASTHWDVELQLGSGRVLRLRVS